MLTLGIVFIIVGFAFKVSAVPFHTWAPDTYEGAPTPVTAFLSVASKAAGFVALVTLIFVGFLADSEVWEPLFWVLSALTMTVGNLIALRQTNIVRMLAYSSIAQGGFILMPLAVVGQSAEAQRDALTAIVTYLIVYAAMNLGAFAVVIAVARKTRSGDIDSYGGLFNYAPALAVGMTIFLFSLAGIPPLGGWIAKFSVFKALLSAGGGWAVGLAVIGGVNSVIALYYYANVARKMWMEPAPDGDEGPIKVPQSLSAAMVITAVATVVIGVLPNIVLRFGGLTHAGTGRKLTTADDLAARLHDRIRRHGPIPFEQFVDAALYDPAGGFYATGGQAGRRGDFLTVAGGRPARSAPSWPGPSTGGGSSSAAPTPTWWSTPEPGRARSPGRSWRPTRPAPPPCATCWSSDRRPNGRVTRDHLPLEPADEAFAGAVAEDDEPPPGGIGPIAVSLAELPELPLAGRGAGQRAARQPGLRPVRATCWRRLERGVGGRRRTARLVEVLVPARPTIADVGCRATRPTRRSGARVPVSVGATAWVARRPRPDRRRPARGVRLHGLHLASWRPDR